MRKLAMPLVPNHCGLGNQQGAVLKVALVLMGPENQKLQRKAGYVRMMRTWGSSVPST